MDLPASVKFHVVAPTNWILARFANVLTSRLGIILLLSDLSLYYYWDVPASVGKNLHELLNCRFYSIKYVGSRRFEVVCLQLVPR